MEDDFVRRTLVIVRGVCPRHAVRTPTLDPTGRNMSDCSAIQPAALSIVKTAEGLMRGISGGIPHLIADEAGVRCLQETRGQDARWRFLHLTQITGRN